MPRTIRALRSAGNVDRNGENHSGRDCAFRLAAGRSRPLRSSLSAARAHLIVGLLSRRVTGGEYDEAREKLEHAFALAQRFGTDAWVGLTNLILPYLDYAEGQLERAGTGCTDWCLCGAPWT